MVGRILTDVPASARRRAVAIAAETDGRRRRRIVLPSRLTVSVKRLLMALPRAPEGGARRAVEAAEERENHTAECLGGRGMGLVEELPTAPDSHHVGARLRADVPTLIRYGMDVDSRDVHGANIGLLSSFVKGIHARERKKIFGPSRPVLYACAIPVLSFSQPHGRCILTGGAVPICWHLSF
jgi:hypothetical protein